MKINKVLIVEDESPKLNHITHFFSENFAQFELLEVSSVMSALDAIEDSDPDLIILDMSLPTNDIGDMDGGGRPQGFGGLEVLTHLTVLERQCPVIVLTGYESFLREDGEVDLIKLKTELMSKYPNNVIGVLHFSSTFGTWVNELKNLINVRLVDQE